MPPFVVFALPRSRTAWLSQFLTYGDWACTHEELRHARTVEDLKAWAALPNLGTVETIAAPYWRTLRSLRPDARVVVVRRPVSEVVASLERFGLGGPEMARGLDRLDAKLRQIAARWPKALSVSFADLDDEATCRAIFEHCLPYAHDSARWREMAGMNIQCSLPHLIRYVRANLPQMLRLAKIVTHQARTDLMTARVEPPEGMIFQTEPFESFVRDARGLIADHLILVGEAPDNLYAKNLGLMQTLSDMGNMQIVTARSNGRMFGYLMTIISPSLESAEITSAIETTFYASPSVPGLGMKLQRFSLQKLKEAGRVDEIVFRAGVRGSGPKMGAIYKRLGAADDGEMYRLNLRTA